MVSKKEIKKNRNRWKEQRCQLGRRLFELRQQNGYSLELLSHKSKIPMMILEDIENGIGHFSLSVLIHLCRVYRHHLIIEIGEPYPPLEQQD